MLYEVITEFRARMDKAGAKPGDISSWDAFHALPTLSKKELPGLQAVKGKGLLGGMVAGGAASIGRIYQSPGPIYDPEGQGPDYSYNFV